MNPRTFLLFLSIIWVQYGQSEKHHSARQSKKGNPIRKNKNLVQGT